ncbi:MAG: aminotransferase class III-fold pyridoxal phosphate-dependent enzyme, partial [Candidatus Tectomicrobia bacterium]|nr:aminotransferase class III-fold pyridoxal phosphate-dependent enzyme [Candidatus Tectomicrobia bacterium]
EHAREVGDFMLRRFRELQEKYECIGDVRGKGLMIGIELVKDRRTKEKLSGKVTQLIFKEALKRGLLAMAYTPNIRINPPLTITGEIAERGIEIFDETLDYIEKHVNWKSD